jgi:hypothetical protein
MIKNKVAAGNNVRQEIQPTVYFGNYLSILAHGRTISQSPFPAAFL